MASKTDIQKAVLNAFGTTRYLNYDAGIFVNHRLVVPKEQIDAFVEQQLVGRVSGAAQIKAMPAAPKAAPKAAVKVVAKTLSSSSLSSSDTDTDTDTDTDMAPVIVCPGCEKAWDACNCGLIWCPFCAYEIPSQTERGLSMHIKSKHPEVEW